jgi:hypothetical protein
MRRSCSLAALLLVSCYATRPDTPLTPIARCRYCCAQMLDARKLDDRRLRDPPQQNECAAACEAGDENEICVAQTNRELAATAQRSAPAPVAKAKTVAEQRGECDHPGVWQLAVAEARGQGSGCSPLDAVPAQVSFRIGRRRDGFVLYDLTPAPGWTDAFSIENGELACVVVLRRENRAPAERPRTLAVELTERDRVVTGQLRYREPSPTAACALVASVTGSVLPPPAAPSPPPPSTMLAPAAAPTGRQRP